MGAALGTVALGWHLDRKLFVVVFVVKDLVFVVFASCFGFFVVFVVLGAVRAAVILGWSG